MLGGVRLNLQSDNPDDLDAPIWGVPNIAAAIRKGVQAT
jgi:hypothetical protein